MRAGDTLAARADAAITRPVGTQTIRRGRWDTTSRTSGRVYSQPVDATWTEVATNKSAAKDGPADPPLRMAPAPAARNPTMLTAIVARSHELAADAGGTCRASAHGGGWSTSATAAPPCCSHGPRGEHDDENDRDQYNG